MSREGSVYIADDAKLDSRSLGLRSRNDWEINRVHDKAGPRDKVYAWRRESS